MVMAMSEPEKMWDLKDKDQEENNGCGAVQVLKRLIGEGKGWECLCLEGQEQ